MPAPKRRIGLLSLSLLSSAAAVALSASGAVGASTPPRCTSIRVSGGDYTSGNGRIYAQLTVTNTGHAACTLAGRPSLRLPRLPAPVTVSDWQGDTTPTKLVILASGQHARANMMIDPGRCDRTKGSTFTLWAHAGFAGHSVTIVGLACSDGTAAVYLGSFRR
jgi:hypothetical protein